MTSDMPVDDYLAQGGVLTSPANVPPRYRAELLKLMASFIDSERAAAAGFADRINDAPGVRAGIAAARIVQEKLQNAETVLTLMGEFGADAARYERTHPWAARLSREADIGAARRAGDMRLALFHYPLTGWVDAVVMHVLMGRVVDLQMQDLSHVSYRPLAEAFRAIAPVEAKHLALADAGLRWIVDHGGAGEVATAVDYWWPRVAASFGPAVSPRFAQLKAWGLRHRPGDALRAQWRTDAAAFLRNLGLAPQAG